MAYTGPYPVAFNGTTTAMVVNNQVVNGSIFNTGKITPGGITVENASIINGTIDDTGLIAGGIVIADSTSKINAEHGADGIFISAVAQFGSASPGGGITNNGTIAVMTGDGIGAFQVAHFPGGISNSGVISASQHGISLGEITQFSGGISNNGGTISGRLFSGIQVINVATFAGGINNSGSISGKVFGIAVFTGSQFGSASPGSGITNSGAISASTETGIIVESIATYAGGISNSGTISAADDGIDVDIVPTFLGGIVNTGTVIGNIGIRMGGTPASVSVFDSGKIVGNGGTAVQFGGGTNTFTLGPGYSITGNVAGAGSDVFQLGGSGNGTFNLANIGASQQYRGFATFQVVGGNWDVTGTGNQGWTLVAGTLELGSGGLITGNATFTGDAATLRFDTGTNQLGGIIAGAVTGDAINLRFQSFTTGDHAVWSQNGATGTLTIETASNATLAALTLAGQYTSDNFEVSADTQNDVLIDLVAAGPINFPHVSPSNVDEWILANGQWTASAQPGSIPSGYQVAGIGDFTGNGTSDILWQNPTTGDTQEWLINNGAWNGTVDLGTHPGSFQIAGTADFNGDGISDVLWTSTSGGSVQTDIWELAPNGQWMASISPGSHPAGYTVAGTGDWTGNGTDGILWYSASTGDTDEWQLNNGQWAASVDLGTHPGSGWTIAGVGDFFDNGRDDVLWTNASGGSVQTDIWELGTNGQWINSVSPGNHPAGYQVVGVGDFTGTGTSDILWYNASTGDTDEWLINNGQWAGSVDLGTHPGSFQIAGVGDFNGDGTKDVLWHLPS